MMNAIRILRSLSVMFIATLATVRMAQGREQLAITWWLLGALGLISGQLEELLRWMRPLPRFTDPIGATSCDPRYGASVLSQAASVISAPLFAPLEHLDRTAERRRQNGHKFVPEGNGIILVCQGCRRRIDVIDDYRIGELPHCDDSQESSK